MGIQVNSDTGIVASGQQPEVNATPAVPHELLDAVLSFTAAACRVPGERTESTPVDPGTIYGRVTEFSPPMIATAFENLLTRGVITKAESSFGQAELKRLRQEQAQMPDTSTTVTYPRAISEEGMPETAVWASVERLIGSNHCQVESGQAFARPVTGTHPLAAKIVSEISTRLKPNLPLTFAYEGVWNLLDCAGDAILKLANHPEPENGGMVVLKSASQSLQQALHLYRSKYYAEHGIQLSETGLAGAATYNVPRPAVLAAVNSHIMLTKAAPLVGIGKEDIFLYDLNHDFQPDEDSVRDAIDRAHAWGRRIVSHLVVAGDAERGVAHSARRLDAVVSERCEGYGYRPKAIVDAAAQWLNFLMWEKSSEWDLRAENDNVGAVIFDPQKIELPFDLSLLLLRDYQDLATLVDPAHCPHPDKRYLLSQANNVLSRGGESIIAAYYYLMNQGLAGLRESRSLIFERSRELADYVRSDPRFTLISEPQGSVVAWRLTDPDPAANWNFIQHINAQQNDRFLLTYNMQCRARTPEQLESSLRGDRSYDGIVAHVMEHNSPSDVRRLIQRLRMAMVWTCGDGQGNPIP